MQFLVAVFLGMVFSYAFLKKNDSCTLKYWRPLSGGLAAGFPHIDNLLALISLDAHQGYQYSLSWSPLLGPLYVLGLAYLMAKLAKQKFEIFYPFMLGCYMVSLFFAFLTGVGVRPLVPFADFHLNFDILHPFDLSILAISLVTVVACYFLPRWQRDIARVGVLGLLIYIGFVVTCQFRAHDFAKVYAEAFKLDVKEIYTRPQPISPFNWRVVIETKDHKLHDTRINLFREDEQKVFENSTRSARINAQYKPLNKAVWRIYRRFGTSDPIFAKRAWLSIAQTSKQFEWDARFLAFKTKVLYESQPCAQFLDITKIGARSGMRGTYMICRGQEGEAVLYRSDDEGTFSIFETMY